MSLLLADKLNPDDPQPGLYAGVPFDVYCKIEAANHSSLKHFEKSPAHYKWVADHGEDKADSREKAEQLGTLIHLALLEPDKWSSETVNEPTHYPVLVKTPDSHWYQPKTDNGYIYTLAKGRGKAREELTVDLGQPEPSIPAGAAIETKPWSGNANYCQAWKEANASKLICSRLELSIIESIKQKCMSVEKLAPWIASPAEQHEVTAIWIDPQTELLCKARYDILRGSQIADVKSFGFLADWQVFGWKAMKLDYFSQMAMYMDGLKVLLGEKAYADGFPRWRWIVVETNPPYRVAYYDVFDESEDYDSQQLLNHGRSRWHRWLQQLAKCREDDIYPDWCMDMNGQVTVPMGMENKLETQEVFA